jgi:hypothetical protein
MKATLTASLLLGALLALPSAALAAPPKAKPAAAPASDADADDAARIGGITTSRYIFDPDDVDGLVLKPEGMPVAAQARARFPSLLHIRGHFVPELVRMAKDL